MLYLVGTPLGNLDDLSLRQARTIAQADLILAEDTRSAQILIAGIKKRFTVSFNQNQRLFPYYKEKEFELLPKIINYLKENLEVVLISESGMPVICDPGNLLVTTCIKKNFPFTVIPSGSAFATALVYSGFNIKHFAFFGFLPKKHSQLISQIKLMQKIKQLDQEMIFGFYESPKRIKKTLEIIAELWPDVQVSLAREMTKKFEEILRGDLKTMQKKNYKGEITVIMK